MHLPPNELYSVFSFIGFVLSAIPFYWHFKARNAGTCLFMFWTGLGCLLQCINSIVWNKNTVNRAPVYCDIATRIQVALNVAVPAASHCINRQLYRVACMKVTASTDVGKRRNLIYDLLIGIGIPILQMITEYVVSGNRYNIFEDFGPYLSIWRTPLAFVLFIAWPVVIGIVSLFYCVMAIYAFYKHRRNHMKLNPSSKHNGLYLRLMAVSLIEILGTIPIGTYNIVSTARMGVVPWKGWAVVHRHYSEVEQIASSIWRNDSVGALNLERFRWSLVASAFLFFALFGLASEAREHYYSLYLSLARRMGKSVITPHESFATSSSSPLYVEGNDGVSNPIVIDIGRNKDSDSSRDSWSTTRTDRSFALSVSFGSTFKPDPTTSQDSDSRTVPFHDVKASASLGAPVPAPPGLLSTPHA